MEQTFFECTHTITKKLVKDRNKLKYKRNAKHRLWLMFFIKICFGIGGLVGVVFSILLHRPIFLSRALPFFVGFILYLLLPWISFRRQRKFFAQVSGSMEWKQTLRFGETITIEYGNSITNYAYDRVRFTEENERYFYLFLDMPGALMVDKTTFTQGCPEDFRAFIEERAAEKEPLWTKRELNRRSRKKALPLFIILILIVIFFFGNVFMELTASNTPMDVANIQWHGTAGIAEEVPVPGGLVVFGVSADEKIHSMILRKSLNTYTYVKGHAYSLASIDEYNQAAGTLFESKGGDLALFDKTDGLVYGIANADWWQDSVSDESKRQYTAVPFMCGEASYVLYYRHM